jgi:signal transduction histidine kinase
MAGLEADADAAAAVAGLIDAQLLGIVVLDDNLVVRRTLGTLAARVAVGAPVSQSLFALHGHDADLQGLRTGPSPPFRSLNVAMMLAPGDNPRLDISVLWDGGNARFLVVLMPSASNDELERVVHVATRQRMLAETELARQSSEIQLANAELKQANEQLALFAHVIAHDLTSPLRALRYQAEDLRSSLDRDGEGRKAVREAAEVLTAQARRMSVMVRDLLAYVRLVSRAGAAAPVDTAALIAAIVASLPHPPGLAVRTTGTWPVIETLSAPLDLVLRNLIDNAIKHHDRAEGLIVVDAQPAQDALEIRVSDDGPGIPRQFQAAMFLPFRRLNADDTGVQGSGMGLTLVLKAVRESAASLDVVSDAGAARGTTFRLRWPGRVLPSNLMLP